ALEFEVEVVADKAVRPVAAQEEGRRRALLPILAPQAQLDAVTHVEEIDQLDAAFDGDAEFGELGLHHALGAALIEKDDEVIAALQPVEADAQEALVAVVEIGPARLVTV